MAFVRYFQPALDSYGDPATDAYGEAIARALPRLLGNPPPLVPDRTPWPDRVGVVVVKPYVGFPLYNPSGYMGVLPVEQQPLVHKPNPWNSRYGGG
jgi:hypothetical protein